MPWENLSKTKHCQQIKLILAINVQLILKTLKAIFFLERVPELKTLYNNTLIILTVHAINAVIFGCLSDLLLKKFKHKWQRVTFNKTQTVAFNFICILTK